jgi:tripartite-type tricarboxylate transporter receptor subunit TctC
MAVGTARRAIRDQEPAGRDQQHRNVRRGAGGTGRLHALLEVADPNSFNATLYDKLSFNFIRDIAPVAGIVHAPFIMVVNPSSPAKAVGQFIAYAKANPGKINMGVIWTGA